MRNALAIFAAFATMVSAADKLEVTSPLGAKFYSVADDQHAVANAEKALAADPQNPGLILKAALAHAAVREYKESIALCTRGIAIAPKNDALYLERGHRELGLRQFTRARADLERAESLNSKDPEIYYHLGLSHYFLGEFAPSAEAFGHAVELAPTLDSRINSSNWLYASLRRAGKTGEAAQALARITPDMKNTEPHTFYYLSLLRFFQGKLPEANTIPPEPPAGNTDVEAELRFDTVAYGVGNYFLYNGDRAKAEPYFRRVVNGHAWMTWGFIGSEIEVAKASRAH